jgi:integrase
VASAEKRGGLWRARWIRPDGTKDGESGFETKKAALDYARDQESDIRKGSWVDPRLAKTTLATWVNLWYPAQDLEPSTLENYKYYIEVHILPKFGGRELWALTPEEVATWEKDILARGYSRRTARDARTLLAVILNDAIPRYIQANPAIRKRGKGRKGQRRIERFEQAEKVWSTPLEALLVAERLAALSGRDEDFLIAITIAYTALRWSELLGLAPKYVLEDAIDIQWKLYELRGRFYVGRPKDGSIRIADLPPFLAGLLAEHLSQFQGRQCTCCERPGPAGPDERTRWCAGGTYVFLAPGCGHYQRSDYGEIHFRPAADGWHPDRSARSCRPVLVDAGAPFPGGPLISWPAAIPGENFIPPRGRGIPRYLSDERTGRCPACSRAQVRRADGRLIAHKANGDRCPGSGQFPGEDLALASWLPVSKGLTPHGLRHGHRVWMDEDKIPLVLQADRLGHDEPGMRGVYGHVSHAMRDEIKAALEARWRQSLYERSLYAPESAVPLLNRLLTDMRDPPPQQVGTQLAVRRTQRRRSR